MKFWLGDNEVNDVTIMTTLPEVVLTCQGRMGLVTLNRPQALNALSLDMVRTLTEGLLAWRDDPQVLAVALRGMGKTATPFGAFCAGGDIRYFHQAALDGNPTLEDFFTEEYTLNHLIHTYPKPLFAMMDGIVMGGGMGIAQGASLRLVTERTKMAMPETAIGLFPDVGGGYFLSRAPGRIGEYLALTGEIIGGRQAVAWGLADGYVESQQLPNIWAKLANTPLETGDAAEHWVTTQFIADHTNRPGARGLIDAIFSLESVAAILQALDAVVAQPAAAVPAPTLPYSSSAWAAATAATLRQRSPLMLHVVLEQIRRARHIGLADDLRMERDMVRHCFQLRSGAASETVEGIRALAVDKDHSPQWNPSQIEAVTPEMVAPFFVSPWPAHAHPLRHLG
jgi:enoyl-CoA hydratase/carnithine racemase